MPRVNLIAFERMVAERGLTATEVSRLAGISSATLTQIRKGETVSMRTVNKIFDALESVPVRHAHLTELVRHD